MIKYTSLLLLVLLTACANSQNPAKNLPHYDLANPQVFLMPGVLREISGIVFAPGSSDTVFAEQDEEGRVFYFKLGDKNINHAKFAPKGDFEDMAVTRGFMYMLRSDGVIYSFPLSQAKSGKIADVRSWSDVLPKGEYEGMFADPATQKLYVLCKHCADEKASKYGGGKWFNIQKDGSIMAAGDFTFDVKEIEKISGTKKTGFHPSAITRNAVTGEWFILSSVNSMLVVLGKDWQVKDVYPLNRSVFNQPEGIAFDSLNNLYISNEGGSGQGNILKFTFRK